MDPGYASLVWGRGAAPLAIPRRWATPGPLGSPRERVVRECRVVEDHGLGLAPQQADFHIVPELGRVGARLMLTQAFEPAPRLVAMAQAVMGHRQERPVLGRSLPAPVPDGFLEEVDRLVEPAGAVQHAAPSVFK